MTDNYELGGAEMESLEFPCDPASLPISSKLPLGDVILEIKSIEVTKSSPNLTGERNKRGEVKVGEKKMVKVQFALDRNVEAQRHPFDGHVRGGARRRQDPQRVHGGRGRPEGWVDR